MCLSETASAHKYGSEVADLLRARLADMVAAETLAELVAGNTRAVGGEPEAFLMDLGQSARLRIRPNHPRSVARPTQAVDLSRVSRIIVISLETNHA